MSPVGGIHPGTPAHPGQAVYDALSRSEQPLAPRTTHPYDSALAADRARVANAAHLARTVLPGPIGDHLYRDLMDWCEFAYRFDTHGEALAIAGQLERMAEQRIR